LIDWETITRQFSQLNTRRLSCAQRAPYSTGSRKMHPPSLDSTSTTSRGWDDDVTGQVSNGLGAAAVGAEHLGAVGEEAAADQWRDAAVADETLAVPVTIIERNELCSAQS